MKKKYLKGLFNKSVMNLVSIIPNRISVSKCEPSGFQIDIYPLIPIDEVSRPMKIFDVQVFVAAVSRQKRGHIMTFG